MPSEKKTGTSSSDDLLRAIGVESSLADLADTLVRRNADEARSELLRAFTSLAEYRNADEWNLAVRVCEALAIVGWGDREPVEAVRRMSFNGNPMTMFVNRCREPRFVDAIWSVRKLGVTMEPGRTTYHASPDVPGKPSNPWNHPVVEDVRDIPLASQRNWIDKSPILLGRGIANCYPSSEPLIESIASDLVPRLDREMRPALYGKALQHIRVTCSFSYFDNASCKTNYVLFDEPRPLSKAQLDARLRAAHAKRDIEEHGLFARNKFELGNFQRDSGTVTVKVHFTRAFSEADLGRQRAMFCDDLADLVGRTVARLRNKKLAYDFDLLLTDFERVLEGFRAAG